MTRRDWLAWGGGGGIVVASVALTTLACVVCALGDHGVRVAACLCAVGTPVVAVSWMRRAMARGRRAGARRSARSTTPG